MADVPVAMPENRLMDFCRRWKVTELAIFGSALREDLAPESDIDVLVSFNADARGSLFDLVRMEEELEALLGRPVDLVHRPAVEQSENCIRRESILGNAEVIYAAGWGLSVGHPDRGTQGVGVRGGPDSASI